MLRIREECSGAQNTAISSVQGQLQPHVRTQAFILPCSASPSSPSCSPFQQHPSTSSGEESSFTYACFHILASTLCSHLTRTGIRELHTSGATRPVTTEDIVENKHSAFSARTNVARDADLVNSYTNMLSQETHMTVYAGKCVSFWIKIRDQLIKVILNLLCFSA